MLDDELTLEISPKLRLDALIARGAFGRVFRGHQLAVARDVAVKVLHADLALDTEPGRLFQDEIRAIGTIDHRNVVRIFDADESRDGRLYFVMELLEGPTLQAIADRGPVTIERARGLVGQLLDGLAAVHAAGHVHADVKPSNAILVGFGRGERVVLVDFGLSRVNLTDRPAEAVGGTRPFMAPEQMTAWKVDAKSDVFSAALVFVKLATGWQRAGDEMLPPLEDIEDPGLRSVLAKALALDPSQRLTAAEFAHALRGHSAAELTNTPFRELAPLTESDRSRLFGRDDDLRRLVRRIEARQSVVLTAPSGVGKTSLLRAGLADHLTTHAISFVYVACERRTERILAEALVPGASSLEHALAVRAASGRVIVILDQIEMMLGADGDGPRVLESLIDRIGGSDVRVVMGVREDMLARMLDASPLLADGVPQVRLAPLTRAGASDAIERPLREFNIGITTDLLATLLDDLERAGNQLTIGQTADVQIYPPHLQLAGSALYEALRSGEQRLTLTHYKELGGFDAIVGGHLDRSLAELSDSDRDVAKAIFLALVTDAQMRALRTAPDLIETVGSRYGETAAHRVLERLSGRRLIAPMHSADGTASWCLVHDTLVARIEAWISVFDLDRRRMVEVVRFHLRQSTPDHPALLSGTQLRELDRFTGLIEELESGWPRRDSVWGPRSLVARSRQILRYRRGLTIGASVLVVAITTFLFIRWLQERSSRQRLGQLSDLNIGRIELSMELFDLDVDRTTGAVFRVPANLSDYPDLHWNIHEPDQQDHEAAGALTSYPLVERGELTKIGHLLIERGVEIRGGEAFLVVSGRGRDEERCAPAVIPLKHLPGHDDYARPHALHVLVPTCTATAFDTIYVPGGTFVYGGLGAPPARWPANSLPKPTIVELPGYSIDRTEITNAEFAIFSEMEPVHEISAPEYGDTLPMVHSPTYPQGGIDWFEARAYCRFLGKDLPTSQQWQKALRGGLTIAGRDNPVPDRNLPWGLVGQGHAHIADAAEITGAGLGHANDRRRPAAVGTASTDRSPYGVVDLAGSVQEWTLDSEPDTQARPLAHRLRITRGGNWFDTVPDTLVDYMATENPRLPTSRYMFLGARCVNRHPADSSVADPLDDAWYRL